MPTTASTAADTRTLTWLVRWIAYAGLAADATTTYLALGRIDRDREGNPIMLALITPSGSAVPW